MTHKEAFETVKAHLLTQGKKSQERLGWVSEHRNPLCLYRGPDNTKCAIGVLIPDEEYHPSMETRNISFVMDEYEVPSLKGLDIVFLSHLQRIHDCYPIEEWEDGLDLFARTYADKMLA